MDRTGKFQFLELTLQDGVAVLKFNRPDAPYECAFLEKRQARYGGR